MKQLKRNLHKKRLIYDAKTSYFEILKDISINFIYSFVANISTPFIVMRYDIGVIFSFLFYYYLLSHIINRDAYKTRLGKYIILPIPCIIGAYLSYKTGYLIKNLL